MAIHNDKFKKGSNLESKLEIKKANSFLWVWDKPSKPLLGYFGVNVKYMQMKAMAAGCYQERKMSEWVVGKKQSIYPRLDMS